MNTDKYGNLPGGTEMKYEANYIIHFNTPPLDQITFKIIKSRIKDEILQRRTIDEVKILKDAVWYGIFEDLKNECEKVEEKIKKGKIKDYYIRIGNDFFNYIYKNHNDFLLYVRCKTASNNRVKDFEIVEIEDDINET